MSTFEAILNDALTSPEKLLALRARSLDADADEEIRKELLEIEETLDDLGERIDDLLDDQPLSIDLHNTALQLAYLRGDEERFDFHRRVLDAIADAVQATGDGVSPSSAYRPLQESEMYLVINRLELDVAGQREVEEEGKTFDVIEGRDAKGNVRSVYFERPA
ncbi:MAG TPA: DUF4919 domain-containing protein [Thermoanaerobaculia bacterium]|nr:DUF4919 domain-containing protein [Thermoanaerobaculia bacterium]